MKLVKIEEIKTERITKIKTVKTINLDLEVVLKIKEYAKINKMNFSKATNEILRKSLIKE